MNNPIQTTQASNGLVTDFKVLPEPIQQTQPRPNEDSIRRRSKHTAQVYIPKFKWTKSQLMVLATIEQDGYIVSDLTKIYNIFNPKKKATNYKLQSKPKKKIYLSQPTRLPSTWRKKDIMFFAID